jgi:hypothetical protein
LPGVGGQPGGYGSGKKCAAGVAEAHGPQQTDI